MNIHDPEDSAPKRSNLTIVLAESNADQRFLLGAALRAGGYHVVETGDGETLRDYLRQASPDRGEALAGLLVVSDLHLRGSDALTVLRDVASHGPLPRFILLTPQPDLAIQNEARRLGAAAVFSKPFDFDDLRVVIRYLEAPHDG